MSKAKRRPRLAEHGVSKLAAEHFETTLGIADVGQDDHAAGDLHHAASQQAQRAFGGGIFGQIALAGDEIGPVAQQLQSLGQV